MPSVPHAWVFDFRFAALVAGLDTSQAVPFVRVCQPLVRSAIVVTDAGIVIAVSAEQSQSVAQSRNVTPSGIVSVVMPPHPWNDCLPNDVMFGGRIRLVILLQPINA